MKRVMGAVLALFLTACAGRSFQECYESGTKAYGSGDFETAVKDLSEAVRKDPQHNEEVIITLAEAYRKLGDPQACIQVLEQGVKDTSSIRLQRMLDRISGSDTPLLKETQYNSAGEFIISFHYEYDEAGMPVRKIQFDKDEQIGTYYDLYEYENGILIKDTYLSIGHPSAVQWYTVYEYDTEGNRVRETVYTADDIMSQRQLYTYENGRLIEQVTQDGSANPVTRYVYHYEGERLTKQDWYSPVDKLQYSMVYTFGSEDEPVKETVTFPDGTEGSYVVMIYDEYGRLIKKENHQSSGTVYSTIEFEYEKKDS